jgi:hypothetical protein
VAYCSTVVGAYGLIELWADGEKGILRSLDVRPRWVSIRAGRRITEVGGM